MIVAIVTLVVLELFTAGLVYVLYRACLSFMRSEDAYKNAYLAQLAIFEEVKNKLKAEGILLLSREEADKLVPAIKEAAESGEGWYTPTDPKSKKVVH